MTQATSLLPYKCHQHFFYPTHSQVERLSLAMVLHEHWPELLLGHRTGCGLIMDPGPSSAVVGKVSPAIPAFSFDVGSRFSVAGTISGVGAIWAPRPFPILVPFFLSLEKPSNKAIKSFEFLHQTIRHAAIFRQLSKIRGVLAQQHSGN